MQPFIPEVIACFQQQAARELADQIAAAHPMRGLLHLMSRAVQQKISPINFHAQPDAIPFAERCELICEPVKE